MANKQLSGIFKLKGSVQNYAWGGKTFLPEFLQIPNNDQKPFAEYWVGVHHRGPAKIKVNSSDWELLEQHTKLPYLLKILDVEKMLSIQSHPNKAQAEIGFALENKAQIPIDAKNRVFKDDNHKPELMMALTEFWLLHGFKSKEQIRNTLASVPEFTILLDRLTDVKTFYTYLMNLAEDEKVNLLKPLHDRLKNIEITNLSHPDYWAKIAFEDYGMDVGIFSIYLYNLVGLKPGEAIYQEAGIPHAYLRGKNVEIMANSDNVFRAGLTPKHMDITLLLSHLDFSPIVPHIITAVKVDNELIYKSPATEFELHEIKLQEGQSWHSKNYREACCIILQGKAHISSEQDDLTLEKGDCFFITQKVSMKIFAHTDVRIAKAICPQ